jgi:hypothetical protein
MKSEQAQAAAEIRKGLKARGIKARVTSTSASMTSSVDVTINQDVTPEERNELESFCNKYQYGHFDGMTDCYEYSNTNENVPQAKFVFVRVDYSDEIKAEAAAYIANINGIEEWKRDQYVYMVIMGSWGDFWNERAAT